MITALENLVFLIPAIIFIYIFVKMKSNITESYFSSFCCSLVASIVISFPVLYLSIVIFTVPDTNAIKENEKTEQKQRTEKSKKQWDDYCSKYDTTPPTIKKTIRY